MIQKPNSLELMNQFQETKNKIDKMQQTIIDIENQMNVKLNIINEYNRIAQETAQMLNQIPENGREKDCVVFGLDTDKIMGGNYDIYGQTVHAAFASLPTQIFNFITETGPLYKDCASVSFIYTEENQLKTDYQYQYCDMLKDEADETKRDVFKKFSGEDITLRIELNHTNLYGNTSCNMIEICPYLPGTFDITGIRVFSVTQYLAEGDEMDTVDEENGSYETASGWIMKDVGSCRFVLDGKTLQIYRIEFDIHIHRQNNGYPFGLRHIYFYNASIDNSNSYVVVALNQEDYIASIGKELYITTPSGAGNINADEMGVEYYMLYNNGSLQNQIESGSTLTRNLKTIYAKIPLDRPDVNSNQIFYVLTSIRFKNIELR